MCISAWLIPKAFIWIIACPGLGEGVGTEEVIVKTSGPPNSGRRMAFIVEGYVIFERVRLIFSYSEQ